MGYSSFVFIFVVVYSASGIRAKQGGNGPSCSPILSIESFGIPIKVGNDIIIKCRACGKKSGPAHWGGNNGSCSPILSIESSAIPVRVGNDVIIKCRACGKKDIFWFKDGKRFDETKRVTWISARKVTCNPYVVEGKLKIDKLRKRDRGVYTCYAVDFSPI